MEEFLNKKIDRKSVQEFLSNKFPSLVPEYLLEGFGGDGDDHSATRIIEAEQYGLETINDLNNIIPSNYIETILQFNVKLNYLGTLRIVMILNDYKKYMHVYNIDEPWNIENINNIKDFLEYHGISIKKILELRKK